MATTYHLKRKTFAFGFASLGKAFKGMAYGGGNAAKFQKVVDAVPGAAQTGGSTAAQTLNNTQSTGKILAKGALGLGTTAVVGTGVVASKGAGKYLKDAKNALEGNMGKENAAEY